MIIDCLSRFVAILHVCNENAVVNSTTTDLCGAMGRPKMEKKFSIAGHHQSIHPFSSRELRVTGTERHCNKKDHVPLSFAYFVNVLITLRAYGMLIIPPPSDKTSVVQAIGHILSKIYIDRTTLTKTKLMQTLMYTPTPPSLTNCQCINYLV